MQTPRGQVGLQRGNLAGAPAGEQAHVEGHGFVGHAHDFAVHVLGRRGEGDVVAQGLAHLHLAVGARQQGQKDAHLGPLAEGFLQLATGHDDVEGLVRAADLHIGLQRHRVVALHEGVEELMQVNRVALAIALAEVLAGQELLHGKMRGNVNQVAELERAQPLVVVADDRAFRVQHLEGLVRISLGIGHDLFKGHERAGLVLVAGVAHQAGERADEEDGRVAQVLELAQFAHGHGVAQVQVRSARVHAQVHP